MIEKKRCYSIWVKPQADMHEQYTAALCLKEVVDRLPAPPECRKHIRPDELQSVLERLAIKEEQVTNIVARFGHEQATAITADIDPDLLEREGFHPI